jgi:peptide/nickel transport system ATP-binding protein
VLAEIDGLIVNFYTYQGVVQAIEGIDLTIKKGETLGIVGETGCGKSVTASAIMRLILSPPGKTEEGSVYFLEPAEVRAKRKAYERQAQEWYSKLPLDQRKKMTAQFGIRFTGFKKRARPVKAEDVPKVEPPQKAPHKMIASYMYAQLKKVPKEDKVSREALTKSYDLNTKSIKYMQKIRGRFISMIFQEPTSALNPVFTAGDQIAEVILQHRKAEMASKALKRIDNEIELRKQNRRPRKVPAGADVIDARSAKAPVKTDPDKSSLECSVCKGEVEKQDTFCESCGAQFYSSPRWSTRPLVLRTYKTILESIVKNPDAKQSLLRRVPLVRRYQGELQKEALREAVRMLDVVRIPDPKGVATRFPFELSGGMQQRVMIAIALACNPKLLIADEPTTALDVTIQGQILKLMRDLKTQYGSSILLITHNLGVVAEMADRVGVMYAGSMAEIGTAKDIFKRPVHPYTMGLMKSVPSIQMSAEKLYTIRGSVPNLIYPPAGCRFHPRCDSAREYCTKVRPPLMEIEPGHFAACHMVSKPEGYVNGT